MNRQSSTTRAGYECLDATLEKLNRYGPDLQGGLFNHAPMVAEALCAMGHGKRSHGWVEAHQHAFTPRPPARASITEGDWQQALGDPTRFSDWAAFFRGAIESQGWRRTVKIWASRLAPGFTTAACHGVIRTAHAARALTHAETTARLNELADGLSAWAALYSELPVGPVDPRGQMPPEEALLALELPPNHEPQAAGPITGGFERLRDNHRFAHQVARIDLSGDIASRLDELIAAFAGLFVASARNPYTAIVFTHAVTGAAAVRNLLPAIGEAVGRELAFRAWEAGCALHAAFGRPLRAEDHAPADQQSYAPAELVLSAVRNGDDHAIKLTEACVTTYARHPARILLQAAAHSRSILPGPTEPIASDGPPANGSGYL